MVPDSGKSVKSGMHKSTPPTMGQLLKADSFKKIPGQGRPASRIARNRLITIIFALFILLTGLAGVFLW